MRTVVLGLVSVLVAGMAPAMACKLDGLELEAKGLPAFEGKRFRVTKVESRFDRLRSPEVNDQKNDGYVLALIEGDAGRFVLAETYSGFGMPADYGRLEPATDKAISEIRSDQRSADGERARVNGVFHIFNDDYEGLSLFPLSCK